VLTPRGEIGPARLVVVAADGSIRTVALPELAAGFVPAQEAETPGDTRGRGLRPIRRRDALRSSRRAALRVGDATIAVSGFTVVDIRAGRVVGTARTSKPTTVLR